MVDGRVKERGAGAGLEGAFNMTFGPQERILPLSWRWPRPVDGDKYPYNICNGCGLRVGSGGLRSI